MPDFMGFAKSEVEGSIPTRFEMIVNHFGDRQAVKSKKHALTYQQLNQSANQLAHAIVDKCGNGEEPIVLICDHDTSVIIGLLGILKAGKAYAPLDHNMPIARLNYVLADLEARLIVTDNKNLALAEQLASDAVMILNVDNIDASYAKENLNLAIAPTTLSSILYTSGSTGKPKGVMRDHRLILHRVYIDTNDFQINASDRIALVTSTAFASSTANTFNPLLNGGTLYLVNIIEAGLNWFTTWLVTEKITIARLPIILFQQWLETLTAADQFPDLRYLSPSGKFYKKEIEKARKHISNHCCLTQQFAATEVTLLTRLLINHDTEITSNTVSVGYAIEGQEVFLVDESRARIGFNEIGEIAVKSRYISLGYWHNPELTQQKFLPSPDGSDERIYFTGDLGRMQPDGCLEWIERKDFMVKIRGYRIEPSEIEGVLLEVEEIKQAAVVAVSDPTGEQHLAAYIVPIEGSTPRIKMIRTFLAEKLPSYLIPSKFMILASLPITLNSKLDRSKLPPIDWSRPELDISLIAPRNPLEVEILEIWQSVLQLDQIGVNDNFVELGGNSIQAMQIVARVLNNFHVTISPSILLQSSTVAMMATTITQAQSEIMTDQELEAMLAEIEQLPE